MVFRIRNVTRSYNKLQDKRPPKSYNNQLVTLCYRCYSIFPLNYDIWAKRIVISPDIIKEYIFIGIWSVSWAASMYVGKLQSVHSTSFRTISSRMAKCSAKENRRDEPIAPAVHLL